MGYEESLRQAKELLQAEINGLKEQLAKKEASLRKLDSFLREPHKKDMESGSLTQRIVELVHRLVAEHGEAISAKVVVKEFLKTQTDVNESTIRSTLYQVSRKQKPTEIAVDGEMIPVRVVKEGPTYLVEPVYAEEDQESDESTAELNG